MNYVILGFTFLKIYISDSKSSVCQLPWSSGLPSCPSLNSFFLHRLVGRSFDHHCHVLDAVNFAGKWNGAFIDTAFATIIICVLFYTNGLDFQQYLRPFPDWQFHAKSFQNVEFYRKVADWWLENLPTQLSTNSICSGSTTEALSIKHIQVRIEI